MNDGTLETMTAERVMAEAVKKGWFEAVYPEDVQLTRGYPKGRKRKDSAFKRKACDRA